MGVRRRWGGGKGEIEIDYENFDVNNEESYEIENDFGADESLLFDVTGSDDDEEEEEEEEELEFDDLKIDYESLNVGVEELSPRNTARSVQDTLAEMGRVLGEGDGEGDGEGEGEGEKNTKDWRAALAEADKFLGSVKS